MTIHDWIKIIFDKTKTDSFGYIIIDYEDLNIFSDWCKEENIYYLPIAILLENELLKIKFNNNGFNFIFPHDFYLKGILDKVTKRNKNIFLFTGIPVNCFFMTSEENILKSLEIILEAIKIFNSIHFGIKYEY